MIKYCITFRNKSYQQFITSYGKLKKRYKGLVVSFKHKLENGLYSGSIIVNYP